MHTQSKAKIESHTLRWVNNVVIALNLCPFANHVVKSGQLLMFTEPSDDMATVLASMITQCDRVQASSDKHTVLLILPNGFDRFDDFLDLVDHAQALLDDLELEGVVQIASFHPQYQFSETEIDDTANYTNRSPYPMLHLLQESSVEQAVAQYPDPESIPERNIERLRAMSEAELKRLVSSEEI